MIVLNSIDQDDLTRLHDGSFPLPDIYDPSYIGRKTIIDNRDIVAYGMVKATLEGVLVLDHSKPLVTKVNAVTELIEAFKADMWRLGYRECHAFIKSNDFRHFLKRLGFMDCQGGNPMVIHF